MVSNSHSACLILLRVKDHGIPSAFPHLFKNNIRNDNCKNVCSQPSISRGSAAMGLTNDRFKIFHRKMHLY